MAIPICPTPVVTGKSAVAMERYMRRSNEQKARLVSPELDQKKLSSAYQRMKERRSAWTQEHETR